MDNFPFDHDSGKSMGRHMSNARAEAGFERYKLRQEIERLRSLVSEAIRHIECLHDADPHPDTAQWLEDAKGQSDG